MQATTANQEHSSNKAHMFDWDEKRYPVLVHSGDFGVEEIQQVSVFSVLPSELILAIFSFMDIVTIFRFLDTCRYHRYLLLNMPDIWRRVRFVPLSEYVVMSSSSSPTTTLSEAAAATKADPLTSLLPNSVLSSSSSSASNAQFSKALHQRHQRPSRTTRGSSSGSSSDSDESDKDDSKGSRTEAHRPQHAENERDRERGGSRTLISEIYAVLRRFRKENGLVDHVREIYMDGTDSPQFPSPLVMLIKFPHLEVLSSRYRRKQTGLTTDIHTLKSMLRDGDIAPHSLRLRRWDIFHPYMTWEDVTGFKNILNAITTIGTELSEESPDNNLTIQEKHSGRRAPSRILTGVQLDIHPCPGPMIESLASTMAPGAVEASSTPSSNGASLGGGMHWAGVTGQSTSGSQAQVSISPSNHTSVASSASPPDQISQVGVAQPCGNIVWALEKCRRCNTPQGQCWRCVGSCKNCNAYRAPPFVNHQLDLQRERSRHTVPGSGHLNPTTSVEPGQDPIHHVAERPRTPPGSISLSQMTNPWKGIQSAYLNQPLTGTSYLQPLAHLSIETSVVNASQPITALDRPPEFSFFD
ncbi:MAG: hypothetical protein J3Q66DRAFT_330259 [Benniella sp.]|nr:MAG: hypothetical protein J3Q66DRAFT_330259 [Benniella sp.]